VETGYLTFDFMSKQIVSHDFSQIILTISGQKVILDSDLAKLYRVETYQLNRAIRRNKNRFPNYFAFLINNETVADLKRQFGISSSHGGRRKPTIAFTEHGALMAATVLNSPTAIKMSMILIEEFIRIRQMQVSLDEISLKVKLIEEDIKEHTRDLKDHGQQIQYIFEAIRELMTPAPDPPKKKIGFHPI